jgi:hypothetical protein
MAEEAYECVFSGLLAGQFVQNVLHAKVDIATPVNPFASALLLAQDISNNGLSEKYLDALPSDYTATSLRVRKISGTGGPTAIVLATTWPGAVGIRAGEISSAQVNPLITWIPTEAPDKPGRTYMPGVSEDDIDQMALSGTLVGALQIFADAWVAGGTLGGVDTWVGAIWRRVTSNIDAIFAGQVSPLIGTQRRRLHPV